MDVIKLVSLHRYWLRADAIRLLIGKPIPGTYEKIKAEGQELGQLLSSVARLEVFYALEYVVIEGYRDLKLKDETIDKLLKEKEYVDYLRRFRNAVFHYDKEPLSQKMFNFFNEADSETWMKSLHSAFDRFFVDALKLHEVAERLSNPEELDKFMQSFFGGVSK